jgi:hypothetical protein
MVDFETDCSSFWKALLLPCEQQVLIELAINSGDFW